MPLEVVPLALRGMSDQNPQGLPDGMSPDMVNVRLFQQEVTNRPGTMRFEQGNKPQGKNVLQVGFGTGPAPQFVMLDVNQIAVYNSTNNTWSTFAVPAGDDEPPLSGAERFSVANTLGLVVYGSVRTALRSWDGVNLVTLPHDLGAPLRALTLLAFNNRIVAVRPSVNGVDEPVNIRWCVNGNPNLWDPVNDGAGLLEVVETSENPLTGGFVLGGRAYLTKKTEILELVATGNLDEVFRAEPRVTGKGMIAPYSWAASDYFGFFVGNDNIYQWDGSNLIAIGNPLKTTIFNQINATELNQFAGGNLWIMGMVNARRHEYWLYIPYGPFRGSQMWIYNWNDRQWYQDQYPMERLQGMGIFSPSELNVASELGPGVQKFDYDCVVLNIDSDGSANTGTSRLVLLDDVKTDGGTPVELGTPITRYVTTKDYLSKRFGPAGPEMSLEVYNILTRVIFQAEADSRIQIGISVDEGRNWVYKWIQVGPRRRGFGFFNKAFTTCRFRVLLDGFGVTKIPPIMQYTWKPGGVVTAR